jgi:hypothetical protein
VSGTLGGPGAADTILILDKTPQGTTLHVRGRDVEEADLALLFNRQSCRWSLLGDASDVRLSETRREIVDALRDCKDRSMTPKEIALATGLTKNVVDQRLPGMTEDGQVVRLTRGAYAHPDRIEIPP